MLTADEKEKRKQHYRENKETYISKAAEWKKANPDKRRLSNRKSQVKSTYGVTWEEYEELYNKAKGHCEICGQFLNLAPKKSEANTSACVDHNHTTGKVRGILCRSCNVALGHFKDNKVSIWNAYKYLEEKDA